MKTASNYPSCFQLSRFRTLFHTSSLPDFWRPFRPPGAGTLCFLMRRWALLRTIDRVWFLPSGGGGVGGRRYSTESNKKCIGRNDEKTHKTTSVWVINSTLFEIDTHFSSSPCLSLSETVKLKGQSFALALSFTNVSTGHDPSHNALFSL